AAFSALQRKARSFISVMPALPVDSSPLFVPWSQAQLRAKGLRSLLATPV
ncbi:pentafunctional AROM polypeptide, partial [Cryptococcus neoformans]